MWMSEIADLYLARNGARPGYGLHSSSIRVGWLVTWSEEKIRRIRRRLSNSTGIDYDTITSMVYDDTDSISAHVRATGQS